VTLITWVGVFFSSPLGLLCLPSVLLACAYYCRACWGVLCPLLCCWCLSVLAW